MIAKIGRELMLTLVGLYVAGFLLMMWMQAYMPVTLGLALLRAALWPLWMLTGLPHGEPLPMD